MIGITRLEQSDNGTIGVILVDGKVICYSLELPWKDNERDVSCIPTGEYDIVLEYSNKYKRDLWELKGIDGRTEVKIHPANYLSDLKGCIGTGTFIGYDNDGSRAVWKSKDAFDLFMASMKDRVGDKCLVRGV